MHKYGLLVLVSFFFGLYPIGLSGTPASASQCDAPSDSVTTFGESIDYVGDRALKKGHTSIQVDLSERDPLYYRLKLKLEGERPAQWSLLITDSSGRPLLALQESDFLFNPGELASELWTPRLEGRSLKLHLNVPNPTTTSMRIEVVDMIIMPSEVKGLVFSAKDASNPDYSSLYSFSASSQDDTNKVVRLGDRVGMLVGRGLDRNGKVASWCCTGVFLSSEVLLTNWHCGSAGGSSQWKGQTNDIVVDRNWIGDFDGNSRVTKTGYRAEYRVTEILGSPNAMLDYALLRLAPVKGNHLHTDYMRPLEFGSTLRAGEGLLIIHHAECKPKAVSLNCRVKDVVFRNWKTSGLNTDFTHDCDTEGGSSGAPVFNDRGQLVGIHHLGFEARSDGKCDRRNKAIDIRQILTDIKKSKVAEDWLARAGLLR